MELLGLWRININWILLSVITGIMMIILCLNTRTFQSRGIKCDNLVKTSKMILIAGKWLMIFEITVTIIGSAFFPYIFKQMVENLLMAFIVLSAIMISNKIMKTN